MINRIMVNRISRLKISISLTSLTHSTLGLVIYFLPSRRPSARYRDQEKQSYSYTKSRPRYNMINNDALL